MQIVRICLVLVAAALAPCSAAVMYQLTGTSSNGSPQPYSVGFTLTEAGFITSSTIVPAAALDLCSTGFESCSGVAFDPISPHDATYTSLEFSTTTASTLFFFDLGALAAPGVYNTVFGAGTGTLTVTETQVIPEPGSVILLLSGASAMIAMRRLRRS